MVVGGLIKELATQRQFWSQVSVGGGECMGVGNWVMFPWIRDRGLSQTRF